VIRAVLIDPLSPGSVIVVGELTSSLDLLGTGSLLANDSDLFIARVPR
jgi:hypothetical protein